MPKSYEYLAGVYDALMYDAGYDDWADYIADILLKYTRPGARVLDAACGTGNIALRLKQRGFDVCASDISEEMLEIASDKAREAGVKLPFVLQDMRQLDCPSVDAVISGCDGVNYLADAADVKAFFLSAYSVLKPGGLLSFDISSAHKLRDVLGDELFFEDGDDITYFWQNSYDESSKCVTMDITLFIRDGSVYKRYDETHIQRAHSVQELCNALAECGFADIKAYSFLSEKECCDDDERIQFIALKAV